MTDHDVFQLGEGKILVVDDVKENLTLLTQFLEIDGYEVTFAMDGEKAIQLACLEPPSLILLDVMMPGIDGFETCRRLKALTRTRDIPVIFITGKTSTSDMVEGFKCGAVDYITKPIQQEELRSRVRNHIQLGALLQLRDELIGQLKQHNDDNMQRLEDHRQQLIEAERLAGLGELVGQLCHEINTPIGTAITATSSAAIKIAEINKTLTQGELTKQALVDMLQFESDSLSMVENSLEYAATLVDSFKRITIDQFNEARKSLEVVSYIKHVLTILKPKLKHTQHKVNFNSDLDIYMESYPHAFSQLLINLVNNSLLHGFSDIESGEINIEVERFSEDDKDLLQLDYRDNGKGIPEQNLTKIFDKYFTTELNNGGSGLGLYIVKQIITETLAGTIECQSMLGKGVHFKIIIPITL